MAEQSTKANLLAKVADGYNAFERLLAPLSEQQMLIPELNDGWSVKDNIAHITSWHRRLLELLQAAKERKAPTRILGVQADAEVDQVNERFYQENKALTLDVVLQQFRLTYIQAVAAIQTLSDEELTSTQLFDWLQGETLWQVVKANTFGHYQEHTEIIQAWLERSRRPVSQE